MTSLLDTHVWVWSQEAPEKLGPKARAALTDSKNVLHVSTISTLEIGRLVDIGVIQLSGTLLSWVEESLNSLRCRTIDVSHEIAAAAYSLPAPFHKDPADRILVATARILHLILLTADDRILSYPHVRTRNARL